MGQVTCQESRRMDGVESFLEDVRKRGAVEGHFQGLLHVLVGRKIAKADGTVISMGMTWRAVADLLKRLRWSPEVVRELGLDPDSLPVRDRQRFWFAVISAAQIESPKASAGADALISPLAALGFLVGPPPRAAT
jgi:hypothetical protein